jgi:hypothetical protein
MTKESGFRGKKIFLLLSIVSRPVPLQWVLEALFPGVWMNK